MDLKNRRDTLGRLLRGEIDNDYIVVTSPDHPLLLTGPDILIGGGGKLTAVYLANAQEVRQNWLLRARYTLARLALPATARHLFVQSGDEDQSISDISQHFALGLSWNERKDLAKIAQDPNFLGQQEELPKDIIIKTRERFAETYLAVQTNQRLLARLDKSSLGRDPAQSKRARLVDYGPTIEGVRENYFQGEILDLPSVKLLIAKTVNESFVLDNSLPIPKEGKLRCDIAAIADVASFRGDPEKALRAAAFAGWALLENLSPDHLTRAAHHVRKRRNLRTPT